MYFAFRRLLRSQQTLCLQCGAEADERNLVVSLKDTHYPSPLNLLCKDLEGGQRKSRRQISDMGVLRAREHNTMARLPCSSFASLCPITDACGSIEDRTIVTFRHATAEDQ